MRAAEPARRTGRLIRIAVLAWLCCLPALAWADKRVALVVGNSAYAHADTLPNPRLDARAMRDTLQRLGFTVVYGEDLDKAAFEATIVRFALAAREADVALAYYAGHGATFDDRPYLVPVDARFASLEAVPYELVAMEAVLGELRRARGLRIALFDACRDSRDVVVATRGAQTPAIENSVFEDYVLVPAAPQSGGPF